MVSCVFAAAIAGCTAVKYGRKSIHFIVATLFAITIFSLFDMFKGVAALVLILGFTVFFASCIGSVFWTLVAEIFPNIIRGTAMSVPVFTQWIANAVVVGFFPWMLANSGPAVTFGILVICSGAMLLFTYYYVPETKGKILEEIEMLWKKS